jgi:hypothetical protein
MTLDLEANEVEVKVLTSLASVTEITGREYPRSWCSKLRFDLMNYMQI